MNLQTALEQLCAFVEDAFLRVGVNVRVTGGWVNRSDNEVILNLDTPTIATSELLTELKSGARCRAISSTAKTIVLKW